MPRKQKPARYFSAALTHNPTKHGSEKLHLSERDSLLVLDLLENPPEPSARLRLAAKAGFVLERD